MTARLLIVNADDFGLSTGVNRGIAEAAAAGIVTSASLMVRAPAAEEAVGMAAGLPGLSLGLHLDLGEWVYREGEWSQLYAVADPEDARAVARELSRQLGAFFCMTGRLPTHLDSHQHVHRQEPVRELVQRAARRLGVPVREATPGIAYCGAFYGQSGRGEPYPEGITVEALLGAVEALPEGVTELACHPGGDDLSDLDSPYRTERAVERRVLCDPAVAEGLARLDVGLISFADLGRGAVSGSGPAPAGRAPGSGRRTPPGPAGSRSTPPA